MKRKVYHDEHLKLRVPKTVHDFCYNFETLVCSHMAESLKDHSHLYICIENGKASLGFLTDIGNAQVKFSETIEDAAREVCEDDLDAKSMASIILSLKRAIKILEKHENQYSDSLIK